MLRVLANDGIAEDGKAMLEEAGFEVITEKIQQEELASKINDYDVLVVRSATKVNATILDAANRLKLVVRAGVGIDNIDCDAAARNGIDVANTPNSASLSVAELAIGHMFALARFIHESNRDLPQGDFKSLKKKYSEGVELRDKTLGLIGFGRIGQETAKLAIGLGMKVIVFNRTPKEVELVFDHLPFTPAPTMKIKTTTMEEVLKNSDYVSLHVPGGEGAPLIGERELGMMKSSACLINCARGGVVDEQALKAAVESGTIASAALDVFVGEPSPAKDVLTYKSFSVTPHIGASTIEAQDKVGKEVAEVIIEKLKQEVHA